MWSKGLSRVFSNTTVQKQRPLGGVVLPRPLSGFGGIVLDANAFCILASPSCNLLLSARTLRAWSLPLDRVVSGWRVIQSQIEHRKAQEHSVK